MWGIYAGVAVALIVLVLVPATLAYVVGSRVRIRREVEFPYRGSKLTDEQWVESFFEACANTNRRVWLIAAAFSALLFVVIGIGYGVARLEQRVVAEPEPVQEAAAESETGPDELSLAIECAEIRASLPDPREHPRRFWIAVERLMRNLRCASDIRSVLLDLESHHIVVAVDHLRSVLVNVRNREHYGNQSRGYETQWRLLLADRDRADDRAALAQRLYGNPRTAHNVTRETRVRFLILRVLIRSGADTEEIRAALEHTTNWRLYDHDINVVTVREMAREHLARLALADSETDSDPQ